MKLRYKIADWISGGEISRTQKRLSDTRLLRDIDCQRHRSILLEIADNETASANATVRRMARLAREGMDRTPMPVRLQATQGLDHNGRVYEEPLT